MPLPEGYQIYGLQMVDDQRGWGGFILGGGRGVNATWLGRTTDGGHTFINVTPPGFEALRSDRLGAAIWGRIYFTALDADTAWAYPVCDALGESCQSPRLIWRTEDGGQSWESLVTPADCWAWHNDCGPVSMQAVDPLHAWLMMARYGRNYSDHDLYRTRDGGETFEHLPLPRPQGALDFGQVSYPVFTDAAWGLQMPSGMVSKPLDDIQAGTFPRMNVTRNGGETWQARVLPMPPGFTDAFAALPPNDRGYSVGLNSSWLSSLEPYGLWGFLLETKISTYALSRTLSQTYYLSADHGQSWKMLAHPGDMFLLDTKTGWRVTSLDPPSLQQTTDGGKTWLAIPQESWEVHWGPQGPHRIVHTADQGAVVIVPMFSDDRLRTGVGVRLESLHMLDSTDGWGVEAGGVTLCTADGARTWTPCQAPDQPAIPSQLDTLAANGNWLPGQPLPDELFHSAALPARFEAAVERSRPFMADMISQYNPFKYVCTTKAISTMASSAVGAARACRITYPIDFSEDYGFLEGYWISRYYETFQDGLSRAWPNAVSVDFIEGQVGWRLVDLNTGLYRLEHTTDNSQTWSELKTVGWLGQLEFVSAKEGWVIARQPPDRDVPGFLYTADPYRPAALLHTVDGGRTWQQIHPIIGP